MIYFMTVYSRIKHDVLFIVFEVLVRLMKDDLDFH